MMNKQLQLSKLMLALASLTLSAGVWAGSFLNHTADSFTNNVNGLTETVITSTNDWDTPDWKMNRLYTPDYMVVDKVDQRVKYLDGVDNGRMVSDEGNLRHLDCMKGDEITDLRTNRSGIITGIKREGTMDVMKDSGHNVRYQYVIFKVIPVK
jgi:hypothetical protein